MTNAAIPDKEDLPRLTVTQLREDTYGVVGSYREAAPAVAVDNSGVRMWFVTRHDDIRRILASDAIVRDVRPYKESILSENTVRPDLLAYLPSRSRRTFFERDGAEHLRMRRMLARILTPAVVDSLRPRAQAILDELLESLPIGEPVDILDALARPLAMTVIGELYGIPASERAPLPMLETTMVGSTDIPKIEAAAQALHEFTQRMAELKRAEPADDVFTYLFRLHEEGQLTYDELTSTYLLMVVAGLEPSTVIGTGILLLLQHSDQLAALLADPTRFGTAVDEILRFEPPFRLLPARYAVRPVELDEVTIPAHEFILFSPAAGCRDGRQYGEPDTFDVARGNIGHLGFGHGPHRCMGAALGRLETEVALRGFFTRFPRTSLSEPDRRPEWCDGKFVRRLSRLTVTVAPPMDARA